MEFAVLGLHIFRLRHLRDGEHCIIYSFRNKGGLDVNKSLNIYRVGHCAGTTEQLLGVKISILNRRPTAGLATADQTPK